MTMSKKLSGLVFSAVLLSAGAAVALPPPLPAGPGFMPNASSAKSKASFSKTTHDFGTVWDHKEVEVKFPFTNEGTEPLEIRDLRSTCGCTVPALEKTEYAPGEGGEITVIFNPHNRSGLNQRTVTVTTNDPQGAYRLAIRAEVKPVLEITNPFLRFRTDKGVPSTLTTTVYGRGETFDANFESADKRDLVSVKKTIAPEMEERRGEMWRRIDFEVTSLPTAAVGTSQTALTFTTTDERRDRFQVQAVIDVKGDLSVNPSRVSLGRLALDQSFAQEVIVSSRSAEPFEIKRVECIGTMNELMTFEWTPLDPEKRDAYRLTLSGTPQAELRQSGKIVVHTDVKDEPTIDVPYYGWVPRERQAPEPPARVDRPGVGGNP